MKTGALYWIVHTHVMSPGHSRYSEGKPKESPWGPRSQAKSFSLMPLLSRPRGIQGLDQGHTTIKEAESELALSC